MTRFLMISLTITLVLVMLLFGGGLALAQAGSFSPASPAYPLQEFAEQQNLALLQDPYQRASYALDLLDRRAQGLQSLSGTGHESLALRELDQSLDQTIREISEAPAEGLDLLKTRLALLLQEIDRNLALLQTAPVSAPELLSEVTAKVLALENMVGSFAGTSSAHQAVTPVISADHLPTSIPQLAIPTQTLLSGTISPQMVAFPPGSAGAEHRFFPLYGKHAELTCTSCHIDGTYAGTKNLCIDCHAELLPAEHYPGLCSDCHLSTTWKEIEYVHNVVRWPNCQLCHLKTMPAVHYPGQCSACHNITAWLPARFNHQVAMATNCQSCHSDDRPANHYGGQCSACHKPAAWLPANFNHSGQANCQSCHSDDRPANHFSGQCSGCHNTRAWLPASFNHSGQADCQSCHSDDRPANHYNGQCSACHNTNTWQGASFSHTGLKDCQSCHTAPAGHWGGQCSQCHSTNGWDNVKVSGHSFPMDHGDAGGECSNCHDGTSPNVNCYRCHNKAETEKKHNEEGILDIAGRCLQCHPNGEKDD